MMKDSYINLLIMKYVTGVLTDSEAVRLSKWISESPENAKLFKEEKQTLLSQVNSSAEAAEFWTSFKNRNAREFEGVRKRNILGRSGYLAMTLSAAAVVVAAVLTWTNDRTPAVEPDAQPQVIAQVQSIPEQEIKPEVTAKSQTVYTTQTGKISRISLPDGTKVILNGDSRLTLSSSFNRNAREVELDGEAFFDVAKDSTRLFIIRCGRESYIVRGTSFNISSYNSDGYSVATLHEGALEARVDADIINLVPGEELRVDDNALTLSKHKVNVENSTNWISTTRIVFEDTPLRQVANRLARKYQVSINVQPEIGNILYTGVNDDETIDEVLRLLEITAPVSLSVKNLNGSYHISKK